MDKDGLVFPNIREYMHRVRRARQGAIGDLEKKSREAGLPVSDPETSDLLEILCRLRCPQRIVEIGTCVGFSALLMHTVCPGAEIITIERNPEMIRAAEANFNAFGAENSILLLDGDAADILPTLPGRAELIFLDAAKGQYTAFLPDCLRLLSDGGLLVCDNVLFNGMVADGKPDIRRNKTIVDRLDVFVDTLMSESSLRTVLVPISDGVTVSLKMEMQQ